MTSSTSPLLSSQYNDDDTDIESSSFSSSQEHTHWFRRLTSRRNILPFFFTLLATFIVVVAVTLLTAMDQPKRKNVILMVSDGMGPASLSLARTFMQYTQGLELNKQLPLDPYIVGTSRTRSHSPPSNSQD
jgi:alkaline phosphatase